VETLGAFGAIVYALEFSSSVDAPWRPVVNRHGDVTPAIHVKSIAWRADRRGNPSPINSVVEPLAPAVARAWLSVEFSEGFTVKMIKIA
jgi:hypothetical protein